MFVPRPSGLTRILAGACAGGCGSWSPAPLDEPIRRVKPSGDCHFFALWSFLRAGGVSARAMKRDDGWPGPRVLSLLHRAVAARILSGLPPLRTSQHAPHRPLI